MYKTMRHYLLFLIIMALPGCVMEPEPLDDVETVSMDSDSAELTGEPVQQDDIGIESTGTWQPTTVENCNDFPCSIVPRCPAAPEGQSCSPLYSQCRESLGGPWVQIYQCL